MRRFRSKRRLVVLLVVAAGVTLALVFGRPGDRFRRRTQCASRWPSVATSTSPSAASRFLRSYSQHLSASCCGYSPTNRFLP